MEVSSLTLSSVVLASVASGALEVSNGLVVGKSVRSGPVTVGSVRMMVGSTGKVSCLGLMKLFLSKFDWGLRSARNSILGHVRW